MVLKVDRMGWIGLDGSPGGVRYRAPYVAKNKLTSHDVRLV